MRKNPVKIIIVIFIVASAIVIAYMMGSSGDKGGITINYEEPEKSEVEAVSLVHQDESEIKFDENAVGPGGAGTLNGLNLLLIDDIKTNCFVKEYLNICRKAQQGELVKGVKISVASIIGSAMAEQGTYEGTPLPKTFLPMKDGKVVWSEEDGHNLSTAYKENFKPFGGGLDMYPASGGDGFIGPFQQTESYFGAQYKPSTMNKKGKADPYFFPDEVAGLCYEAKTGLSVLPKGDYSENVGATAMSLSHDPGPAYYKQELFGTKGEQRKESIIDFTEMLEKIGNKYNKELSNAGYISYEIWKFIFFIGLIEEGGNMATNKTIANYVYQSGSKNCMKTAWNILHKGEPESKMWDLVEKSKKSLDAPWNGNATCIVGWKGKYQHYSTLEGVGHAFATLYSGQPTYAAMLKYAGVNVDPKNPDTYLNKSNPSAGNPTGDPNNNKPGTWTPTADSWVNGTKDKGGKNHTFKNQKYDGNMMKVLNAGIAQIGKPYIWGGTGPNGFDCSGLVGYAYKQGMGIDLPRTTYQMLGYSKLKTVQQKDLIPGDLIFTSPGHVTMYIGKDDAGTDMMLAAPQTGDIIKIQPIWKFYTARRYTP